MLIGARNTMFNARPSSLPYDAEVEYLESTGTQYIDLGVNSTADGFCDFDLTFAKTDVSANIVHIAFFPPFGFRYGATARYGLWCGTANVDQGQYCGVNNANYAVVSKDTNWHVVRLRNGQYVDVDGVQTQIGTGTVRTGIKLYLFACITDAGTGSAFTIPPSRISSFCLYGANDTVLLDMIPVRIGETGYMYDRANPTGGPLGNGLYPNSGTGDFVLGRDVNPISARSYVQDGLIAMWDGIENAGWGQHDPNATTWKDLTGQGYDGVVGSGVTVLENSMAFNGVKGNANAVNVGQVTFGEPTTITAEAVFIKDHDAEVSAYNEAVFGQTEAREPMITMFVKDRLSVQYKKLGATEAKTLKFGTSPFRLNEFTTAAFRYSASEIQLLINGLVVASDTNDGTAIDMASTTRNFYIGGDAYYPEEYTLLGRVFCVRLYSRALTAAEIADNYSVDKARFNLS